MNQHSLNTMDKNQPSEVTNVPGNDLELELEKLKDENESLKTQHNIEKLKLENQSLKWENQVLNLRDTNKNLVHENGNLKDENEELKEKVEKLNVENKNLTVGVELSKQQVSKAKVPAGYATIEERLTEGVSRYIEGIEPKTKTYDSYVQWYDDILERMDDGAVYKNKKYLFFCKREYGFHSSVYFDSQTEKTFIDSNCFKVKSLNEGWTHENTRLVCILHPKNPHQLLELYKEETEKDQRGHVTCYTWKALSKKFTESREDIEKSAFSTSGSMILCCIKH